MVASAFPRCAGFFLMFGVQPLPRTLAAALRDAVEPRKHVRSAAIADLVAHGRGDATARQAAVKALCERLLRDEHAELRGAAAVALADVDACEAVPELVQAGADQDPKVRQLVLLALGELGVGVQGQVRRAIHAYVLGQADSALPALRFQALAAAQKLELDQLPRLILTAAADDDSKVRYLAMRVLAMMPYAQWSSELKRAAEEALRDDDARVAVGAALALAPAGHVTAQSHLSDAINRGVRLPEAADQQALIETCGELKLGQAAAGLRRLARPGWFSSGNAALQWHAQVALASLGDRKTISDLHRALSSGNRPRRESAAVACAKAGLPDAGRLLADLHSRGRIGEAAFEQAQGWLEATD